MATTIKRIWNKCDIEKIRDVGWLRMPYFSNDAIKKKKLGKDFKDDFITSLHHILLLRAKKIDKLRGLALVCGDMAGERHFFQSNLLQFYKVDGIDISEVSLEKAVKNCEPFSFDFNPINADVNYVDLKENYYDFIIGHHGIHHIEELDKLFKNINKALKPEALFCCDEYIGPNYVQVPLSNRIFAAFFVNLLIWPPQKRVTHEGKRKIIIRNINFRKIDPSEAVKSENIIPCCKKYLNILKLCTYGGLNYPSFEGLGYHFQEDEETEKLMYTFIHLEKILMHLRLVRPLFCYLLAEKVTMKL
jgi:SAM-dependent methyltransferase